MALTEWIGHSFVVLLVPFGVALFFVARSALASRLSPGRPKAWGKSSRLVGTALLCLLATDATEQIDHRFQLEQTFVLKTAAVGAATAASLVFWKITARSKESATASADAPINRMRGVCVLWLGVAAWYGGRFYLAASPALPVVDDSQFEGGLCEAKEFVAWSDRGREIRLFHLVGEADRINRDASAKSVGRVNAHDDYPETAILRQSRSVRSNCHGWVFCDGRFILPSDDVDHILEDNGYGTVDLPRGGDLIVYRDANGQVLHSGVVRGVLDDGTVMVESKWGIDRRYLHTSVDQPYSQLFTYYRSPRHGHRLTVTRTLPADLRLSPDDKRALRSILHVEGHDEKHAPAQSSKESIAVAPPAD